MSLDNQLLLAVINSTNDGNLWIALIINLFLLLFAYLLGSIPTGYWLGKVFFQVDIFQEGSQSMGATNVLRTLGKIPAISVLLIDVLKGVIPIILIKLLYQLENTRLFLLPENLANVSDVLPWLVTLAGLASVFGHTKSIWIGWRGGKSVATSLGVLLAMCWQVGLGAFAVFAISLAISRIVSLSSILAAIAVSLLMFGFQQPLPYLIFGITAGIYVIWRHRANIQRILNGQEPRIGQKLATETREESV